MDKAERESHPHPRQEPKLTQPLTPEGLAQVFQDCADFTRRTLWIGNDSQRELTLCYLDGMVRGERVSDYLLRPLLMDTALRSAPPEQLPELLLHGAQLSPMAQLCPSTDEAAEAMVQGSCLLFFPGSDQVLSVATATEEKRSVGEPENEPSVKGARDSFVESVRTNTSLVRRRIKSSELRIREHTVGRQTLTSVDVLWLDGIANNETVTQVEARIDAMDIDGIQSASSLEEYIVDKLSTPFPLVASTQRPDWFCSGLLEGRIGILCDGQSLGWLLPGTVSQFFRTEQDKSQHWLMASTLRILRFLCMIITLVLPALYVAVVTFHPEVIPLKLALSIAAAKQEVPFPTAFEVLIMLLSFEVLQEAGLRLPGPIGQTVSILGGLVVGSAAVEARIVSPAVLIAVAAAGIAGYTMPSQDFANALRLWRFLLTVLASFSGLLGLVLGVAVLLHHLAGLESFGVPYLGMLAGDVGDARLTRQPLPKQKLRPGILKPDNRRNQR